jgi:putative flippase GtrA
VQTCPTFVRRVLCFVLIGIASTALYYAALIAMVELIAWPVMVATTAAFGGVVFANYFLHRRLTFRNKSSVVHTLIPYVFMCLGGFGINAGVMWVGLSIGCDYRVVQAVAIVTVVVWNFVGTTRIFINKESGLRVLEGADHAIR